MDRARRTHFFARWWWTVDRLTLAAVGLLACFGLVLVIAASPAVAERIGAPPFHFVYRQALFVVMGIGCTLCLSWFPPTLLRRLAPLAFIVCLFPMILVPFAGVEVKGAHRWLSIAGFSLQPSEFMKPCFALFTAWVLARKLQETEFPGYALSFVSLGVVISLLALQPDLGMTITVAFVWGIQLFLAGLPMFWVVGLSLLALAMLLGAYLTMPHAARRIDAFLNPESEANYQVRKSLQAFESGGLAGRGPGEGVVKQHIPDAHTDFIFAVAAEEYGVIVCLFLLLLFAFVVLRAYARIWKESEPFVSLAVAGIVAQFGFQAIVNTGVSLGLLPTKGMTLPFISYGGSSFLGMACGMGLLLALTRKRYGRVG